MILLGRLVQNERAYKLMPRYVLLAVLLGGWIWMLARNTTAELGAQPFDNRTPGVIQILCIVWSIMLGYLINVRINWRSASLLDAALPISTRRLWLTHVMTMILTVCMVPTIALLTVGGGNLVAGEEPILAPGLISLWIHLLVSVALAVVLLQLPSPRSNAIRLSAGYILWAILVLGGILPLSIYLSSLPRLAALVPLGAALGLGVVFYHRLPPAFTTADPWAVGLRDAAEIFDPHPTPASAPARATHEPWSHSRRHPVLMFGRILWRSAIGGLVYAMVPFVLFLGIFLSFNAEELLFSLFVILWVLLAGWTKVGIHRMHRLDALPIPRRAMLPFLLVPPLVTVILGYALGATGVLSFIRAGKPINFRALYHSTCICVAPEYWEITTDPDGASIFPGAPLKVRSPYRVDDTNTPAEVAAELQRALKAIYDCAMSAEEIAARFLTVGETGGVHLQADGEVHLEDLLPAPSRARGRRWPVVLLVVAVPWLLHSALIYRIQRSGLSQQSDRLIATSILGPYAFFGVLPLALHAMGHMNIANLSRATAVLIHRAGTALPGVSLWLAAAFLLAAAYALTLHQFNCTELRSSSAHTGD